MTGIYRKKKRESPGCNWLYHALKSSWAPPPSPTAPPGQVQQDTQTHRLGVGMSAQMSAVPAQSPAPCTAPWHRLAERSPAGIPWIHLFMCISSTRGRCSSDSLNRAWEVSPCTGWRDGSSNRRFHNFSCVYPIASTHHSVHSNSHNVAHSTCALTKTRGNSTCRLPLLANPISCGAGVQPWPAQHPWGVCLLRRGAGGAPVGQLRQITQSLISFY